ncbi:hypothetical protein PVAP13_5KG406507 [Panicum virgatum]|uniref:Histone deacetylase domain-containing protein n=1 Tax=Panicum virgatum TaxID=38727 RepID=A0A8T0SJG9_PANVG|nr:hypothetical protein PVAP13_5KG406507 [Panicum virgatum]
MNTGGNSLPPQSCPDGTKRRVCYYYDRLIAGVDYGEDHVMVPRRVDMAHAPNRSYGLLGDMARLRTRPATDAEISVFHDGRYVGLLRDLTPEAFGAGGEVARRARGCNVGAVSADGRSSGGMHHACRDKASGFCYVNDIVLAIDELLGHFRRVLYVDIDVHHGDGVEPALVGSNRVMMTVSFHQRTEDFFPERRGLLDHVGEGDGRLRVVNGMDDEGYRRLFKPIMSKVMAVFQPEAIVMQCGGDSLSGDRLGQQNLSISGHARCVGFLRSFSMLLLGGGGYTINHVAACWCYRTAVAIAKKITDDIPAHCYDGYYQGQGYKLQYPVDKNLNNDNTESYVTRIKCAVLRNLCELEAAPSIEFKQPAGGSIDTEALLHKRPPREDDDPMERMHRQCGEMEERGFFMDLGKRQLDLVKDNKKVGESATGGSRNARTQSADTQNAAPIRWLSLSDIKFQRTRHHGALLASGTSDKARSEQNQRSCIWRPARMLGRTVARARRHPVNRRLAASGRCGHAGGSPTRRRERAEAVGPMWDMQQHQAKRARWRWSRTRDDNGNHHHGHRPEPVKKHRSGKVHIEYHAHEHVF